jgi:tRNA (cytidine56-2'-O)-methyltransferase
MAFKKDFKVNLLRLNHRLERDKRVTTHLFLAARALGVESAFYSGQKDKRIEDNLAKIRKYWGGTFKARHILNWKKNTKKWKETKDIIHLTMYGLPIQNVIAQIRESSRDKVVIVGGAKVLGLTYKIADWNVSITSQPHSEISALSIFLHEVFKGKELVQIPKNALLRIIPQKDSKRIDQFLSKKIVDNIGNDIYQNREKK